jgi:hypothetical protein
MNSGLLLREANIGVASRSLFLTEGVKNCYRFAEGERFIKSVEGLKNEKELIDFRFTLI